MVLRTLRTPPRRQSTSSSSTNSSSISLIDKTEYTIEEGIPPYSSSLNKELDIVSYDPRYSPCLRINTNLVKSEIDLKKIIEKFKAMKLLPNSIDLWTISHIDELEFERMIPILMERRLLEEKEEEVNQWMSEDATSKINLDAIIEESIRVFNNQSIR